MKTKLIILSLALLALAVVPTWAAHNGSLSLGLGLSMGPGGGVSHGPAVLMESSGYVLMETGTYILTE